MHTCILDATIKSGPPPAIYACGALGFPMPISITWKMNRIRELRRRAGLTQGQLAEMSGLSQPFISRLERGKTDVTSENLRAIADVLMVPMSSVVPPGSQLSRLLQVVDRVPASHADQAAMLLETFLEAVKPPDPERR
jgi:transcriptional regulator with XRE-family HTH domain